MAKLISCAVLVLLAMTGWSNPALAQVPGGGGEVVCQEIDGGFVSQQSGGAFPVGPVSCGLTPFAKAEIAGGASAPQARRRGARSSRRRDRHRAACPPA